MIDEQPSTGWTKFIRSETMNAFAFLPTNEEHLQYVRYCEHDEDLEGGGIGHWEGFSSAPNHVPCFDDEFMFDANYNVWLFRIEGYGDLIAKEIVGKVVEVMGGDDVFYVGHDDYIISKLRKSYLSQYVFPKEVA